MSDIVEKFQGSKVAVIGDLMLDIYIQGVVERISPEAPVPVLSCSSEKMVPGGAANVAANAAALGASVFLVGLAGPDDNFHLLAEALKAYHSVDISGVLLSVAHRTTTKTRIVSHRQQIVRIDRETAPVLSADVQQSLIANVLKAVAAANVVIVSDYGKGVLQNDVLAQVFAASRDAGKPVIVDPKRRDLSAYRGATVITPNRAELAASTGLPCITDEEVNAAAHAAQLASGADILVTRSEKGMSFVPVTGDPVHLPTVAREVFDVSGAGDTVVATLGVSLAANFSFVDAMKAANHAAGLAVAKTGTATVSAQELAAELEVNSTAVDINDGSLLTLDKLVVVRDHWRKQGLTVGLANGCYDLLHPGHISLIKQATDACDRLVMALNTDRSVRNLKGPSRPVQTEVARAEVMGSIKGVSAVILFDEETPLKLIEALVPDLIVKGADYTEDQVVGADIMKATGGRVLLAKLTEGQSTSNLLSKSKTQ